MLSILRQCSSTASPRSSRSPSSSRWSWSRRAIWLTVVPPRRCVKEASCEKCKYPVAGLSTWTCPECGSHLLAVGIITRSMEVCRRGGYVGAIGGLFFLLLIAVIVGLSIVAATIGNSVGLLGAAILGQTATLTPASGAYPPLTLEIEQDWSQGVNRVSAVLRSTPASSPTDLRIRFSPGATITTTDASGGVTQTNLDKEALAAWLGPLGIEAATPGVQTEIGELAGYLQGSAAGGVMPTSADLQSFSIGALSTTSRPVGKNEDAYFWFLAAMWSIPAAGLILFVLFTVLIVRRRRKLLRAADTTVPTDYGTSRPDTPPIVCSTSTPEP